MIIYREFVERKSKKVKKKLDLIKKMFEKHDMEVKDNLNEIKGSDELDPYLFVVNPNGGASFGGARVYSIGGEIAYRAQRDFETHPFGRAYHIDIEQIFDDASEDDTDEKKAAQEVVDGVVQEVQSFFKKSEKAEKDSPLMTNDPLNQAYMRSTGNDYANQT